MVQTFTAHGQKLKEGLQVEVGARDFKFILDEPKSLGGTDKGMNPVEAVLCSLAACQTIVVAAFAKMKNFSYDDVRIEVEGDLDPDGFMGKNPDVRNGFQEIRFKVYFKTNESQEKAEEFVRFVQDRCPVGDCLEHPVPVKNVGVIIE